MPKIYPAIVIGSGFGGAVAALRLAERGIEALVIERGRKWDQPSAGKSDIFPPLAGRDIRQSWRSKRHPLVPNLWRTKNRRFPGLLQRIEGKGVSVVCGAAFGGGSVVYGGMMLRPEPSDFDRIFDNTLRYQDLAAHYDTVENTIGLELPRADVLAHSRFRAVQRFEDDARKAGLQDHIRRVKTAVDWSRVADELAGTRPASAILGEAVMGFNSGAMKSLDKNYLRLAAQAATPIEVRLHTVVRSIRRSGTTENPIYHLSCIRHGSTGTSNQKREYVTRRVFFCAGSMNTTPLLMRAREHALPSLSAEIGKGWGNNGDILMSRTVLPFPRPSFRLGATKLKWRQGAPPATSLYFSDAQGPIRIIHTPGPDVRGRALRHLGMSIPYKLGRFAKHGDGYRVEWSADNAAFGTHQVRAKLKQISDAAGGAIRKPFIGNATYHPLGGVVLSNATDSCGRLRPYKGLYVVDSSLIPGHTACCNPAWTVAALAEYCMAQIIAQDF